MTTKQQVIQIINSEAETLKGEIGHIVTRTGKTYAELLDEMVAEKTEYIKFPVVSDWLATSKHLNEARNTMARFSERAAKIAAKG